MTGIRWSGPTRLDMAEIDTYYAERAPEFADPMLLEAIAAAHFLSEHPHAGPQIGLGPARKWRVRDTPYLLHYVFEDGDIQILRVRHERQDWQPRP